MANAATHRSDAALILGIASALEEYGRTKRISGRIIAVAGGGALCGTLPDLVEPATNPNHRRFFHSIAFAVTLAIALREIYIWDVKTDGEKLLKVISLVAGGAYLIHLLRDSTTKKSLPLI